MTYTRFALFNLIGGLVWAGIFLAVGYTFGGVGLTGNTFALVALGVVALSLLVLAIEALRVRYSAPRPKPGDVSDQVPVPDQVPASVSILRVVSAQAVLPNTRASSKRSETVIRSGERAHRARSPWRAHRKSESLRSRPEA
jgi:hypothetical protein